MATMSDNVDYIMGLNNYLGRRDVQQLGNFKWEVSWTGQADFPIWHATAKLNDRVIGQGQGVAKGPAKRVAAFEAMKTLGLL